jgi:hypothetical protein
MLQELQDQGFYEISFAQAWLKPGDVGIFNFLLNLIPLFLLPD